MRYFLSENFILCQTDFFLFARVENFINWDNIEEFEGGVLDLNNDFVWERWKQRS
jgi:hypothetical protein